MKEFKTKVFETDPDELNIISNEDDSEVVSENYQETFIKDIKVFSRFVKKKTTAFISKFLQDKFSPNFANILYLTLDCPPFTSNSNRLDTPLDYINSMRNQYPENDLRVMIPIINLSSENLNLSKLTCEIDGRTKILKRTPVTFEFFAQNRVTEAVVYKFPMTRENIQVYGIYSPAFSYCKNVSELSRIQYLTPFLRAARIAIKKLWQNGFKPHIVHSENIPFYLGSEFNKKCLKKTKVLQTIKDFIQIDIAKSEAFWAAINIADKNSMKKICQDKIIKKHIAALFKLHNANQVCQMKDCLKFIYKNYYKYRKYIDKGEDVEENIIFNRLNTRILEMFPNLAYFDESYFNPYSFTLKRVNSWVTFSETYYNEIFNNPKLSGNMFLQLTKTKEKSNFVSYGINTDKYGFESSRDVYQSFNEENFREFRGKNKSTLIKEFSGERVKTNFVDQSLFVNEEVKILGSLDNFYSAPLLFAHTSNEVFANGVDILFDTILKLFELHKNIQVIICIKDGLKNNFIKSWLEFLEQNKYLNGRCVFIDGKVNLSKFYASSDITLIPRRANQTTPEHYVAMHYGCVPVVARNGILNDTVADVFDNISSGCGLKTKKGLTTEEDANALFLAPVMKALNIYQHNPSSWNLLIKNCLTKQCNWSFDILEKYNQIYKGLL